MKDMKKAREALELAKKTFKDFQPSNESKSNGQIGRRIGQNLLFTMRTLAESGDFIQVLYDKVYERLQEGDLKTAMKLFELIKEPEEKKISLNGDVGVKKIFITPEQQKEVLEHIDDVINDRG